jgi:arsenite methyltransferase
MNMAEPGVKQCCASFYGSDLAHYLLGDSFHPGGTALTTRLGSLLGLSADSHVLDVASGRGTSVFHLAETFGCRVTGVDLSQENVNVAAAEAERLGLASRVEFQLADAEGLPFEEAVFDAIVCECAFCTFPDKPAGAKEFFRVLRDDGQVGVSDLTRSAEKLPELEGLLAWIACIGDALPQDQYQLIFTAAGFHVQPMEDHSGALLDLVERVQSRLLGAEILSGLKRMDLPGVDFATAKQFAQAARGAVRGGQLGYAIFTAAKSSR